MAEWRFRISILFRWHSAPGGSNYTIVQQLFAYYLMKSQASAFLRLHQQYKSTVSEETKEHLCARLPFEHHL